MQGSLLKIGSGTHRKVLAFKSGHYKYRGLKESTQKGYRAIHLLPT